ncbi:MAG: universal stress protein [Chitinophagaceae bacterium]|nr:universal stress protein [Chitinophagaceae bacterium]
MQTIVVPSDFSPEARNAGLYAAELAKIYQAKLVLFHAYMLPTPVSEVPYVMITVDELQKENEILLKKEVEHMAQTYGVETEGIVRIGIPSDEIRVLAEDLPVDLVVMGMKGAGGIDKMIGSTTTNSIRKLRTPVLVIPHHSRFSPIRNITYASDFSYESNPQLFRLLIKLAKTFQAKLHVINVHRQKEDMKTRQMEGKLNIENIFQGIEHTFDDITHQSIMQGIMQYMETHASELLVMVEHKHSFLERIFSRDHTTAMAYETKTPLLILQDKN